MPTITPFKTGTPIDGDKIMETIDNAVDSEHKFKFDFVNQENAKKAKIIIGFQVGFMGFILRIGLYRQL